MEHYMASENIFPKNFQRLLSSNVKLTYYEAKYIIT